MPEQVGMLWSMPETKKKAPIIKVSCGIGDTDAFPAFDIESDAYDTKDDSKWGFLITGGAEFHMPLTVFQVSPDGIADKSGIRLGDIILEINEEDASQLTLAQAHERINATPKKVQFLLRNMEEDDPMGMYEAGEEKSIVMRVPKPMPPPKGRVLPSSIETRLLEMQRKLSAIAEIPKILSSTLATVSQSFGTLSSEQLQRKCSYDEDALDFELMEQIVSESDSEQQPDEEDELEDDDLVQLPDNDDDANALVKQFKSKDITPESDYASEANYSTNELSDEPDNNADDDDDDDDDTDDDDVTDDKTVYYIKLPAVSVEAAPADKVTEAETVNISSDSADDENDSDFLSTTYTWNLRNVPKLRINDAEGVCDLALSPQLDMQHNVRAATPTPQRTATGALELPTTTGGVTATATTTTITGESPSMAQKLLFKLDNLERAWPWADREKIIYKQSTCHLVPRKPLGIVGQRIQLLAKQELLRKDKSQ